MRRIAVVIGLLAMCLGVGVAAGGPAGAAPGSCHTGTPPVAGASAGVDQQTPRPGEYIFVVCVYPTPVRGLEGRTDVQAAPGSGSGYTWLNFGAGGGVCEYDNSVVGTHAFMCGGASSAGVIMVPPGADGATFFGGAGACAADETSIWATCLMTIDTVFVDGESGKTMGVGTANAVCYQGVYFTCFPYVLPVPVPASVYIDLMPVKNAVVSVVRTVCKPEICNVAAAN